MSEAWIWVVLPSLALNVYQHAQLAQLREQLPKKTTSTPTASPSTPTPPSLPAGTSRWRVVYRVNRTEHAVVVVATTQEFALREAAKLRADFRWDKVQNVQLLN